MDPGMLAEEAANLIARNPGARLVPTGLSVLKETIRLCEELQQAREDAKLKPSMARKLNERIKELEQELEELKTGTRFGIMEKKIQSLEADLRSSYASKNFTLRNSLLELEKHHRRTINADEAVGALWRDVASLLDDKGGRSQRWNPSATSPRASDASFNEDDDGAGACAQAATSARRALKQFESEGGGDAAARSGSFGGGAGAGRSPAAAHHPPLSPAGPLSPYAASSAAAAAAPALSVPALAALLSECVTQLQSQGVLKPPAKPSVAAAASAADGDGDGEADAAEAAAAEAPSAPELEGALVKLLESDAGDLPRLLQSLTVSGGGGGGATVPLPTPPRAAAAASSPAAANGGGGAGAALSPKRTPSKAQHKHHHKAGGGAGDAVLPPLPPTIGDAAVAQAGSGVMYGEAGSELTVAKVAVGQSLDLLSVLARSRDGGETGSGDDEGDLGALQIKMVRAEELTDLDATAKEINSLRASSMQLAAQLSVSQSLVAHLNGAMKMAIEKADDGDATMGELMRQLEEARQELGSISEEKSELTRILIEAKVELAESKGVAQRIVRDMRRILAEEKSAVSKVIELETIIAARMPWEDEPGRAAKLISAGAALLRGRSRGRSSAGSGGSSAASESAAAAAVAAEVAAAAAAVSGEAPQRKGLLAGLRRGSGA